MSRSIRHPAVIALGALGALLAGAGVGSTMLLRRQAALARQRIGKPHGEVPDADRTYKPARGNPIELLVLGDSIAASLGVATPNETFGARLAKGISRSTRRAVTLRTAAVVGAESSMLAAQLASLPADYRADVAVIVVGGNDVTHRVPVDTSVRHLSAAVRALHDRGSAVVVGTCPNLGALRPVPQPLRALGGRASRQLAVAQRAATLGLGAYAVELAAVVGPFFITNPDEMFSLDRFHPSALGYRRTAAAVLPSVLVALGGAERLPFGHHAPENGLTRPPVGSAR
ncbi:SGNH/GDSL hydrolase family protein [Microbacterium sp. P03]|uniref:SGNH/GDSL hydrolase family protein n=1 Tax=Microbacterium sp. P03 TaxID=3366946 RepID=UPI003745485D